MSTDTPRPERVYRPGDRALVLFGDGVRRPATLSDGFAWVADGNPAKVIFAEGGFDAEPAPRPERVTLTDEERFDLIEQVGAWFPTGEGFANPQAWAIQVADHACEAFAPILAAREQALREEIGVIAADALTIAAALVRSQGEERTHVVDGQKRHLSTIAKGIHQRLARIARGETR